MAAPLAGNLPPQAILNHHEQRLVNMPRGQHIQHYDVGTRVSLDPPPLGWRSCDGFIYAELKAHYGDWGFNRVQYSGYMHEAITALESFQAMVGVAWHVRPPSRISTTLQRIHMAYQEHPDICDQTKEVQLGGYYLPTLAGVAPTGPATSAAQSANQGRRPPQVLVPDVVQLPAAHPGFRKPVGIKINAQTLNSANYCHHP